MNTVGYSAGPRRHASNPPWLAVVCVVLGILVASAFTSNLILPHRASVLILALLTIIGIASLRVCELSILSRLYVVLFSLPFTSMLGYLFDANFIWTYGAHREAYCLMHDVIGKMLMTAIVGLCGLISGMEIMARLLNRGAAAIPQPKPTGERRTLFIFAFAGLLIVAFGLSWMHAPTKTIFEAAYATAGTGADKDVSAGLNGAFLVSYLILLFLAIDLEMEPSGSRRRRLKSISFMAVLAYIVVVLQCLRGDRESAGLIVGIAMLYITRPATDAERSGAPTSGRRRRAMQLALPLAGCVIAFLALGPIRGMLREPSKSTARNSIAVDVLIQNTWTSVVLNNLGLAMDDHFGKLKHLHGRTYVDYFQSIPPRFLAMKLGYKRPMDGPANPAMWYKGVMSTGGNHPVVVPFRNFGIWGVLSVLFLSGALICYCEIQNERGSFSGRLLYGSLATCSLHWFWYTDMNLIRTLMMWGIFQGVYRFVSRPDSTPRSPGLSLDDKFGISNAA